MFLDEISVVIAQIVYYIVLEPENRFIWDYTIIGIGFLTFKYMRLYDGKMSFILQKNCKIWNDIVNEAFPASILIT